jgi:cell division septation protein DedD
VATAAPHVITPPTTLKPMPKPAPPPVKSAAAESAPARTTTKPAPAITPETKSTPKVAALNPPAAEKTAAAASEQTTEEHAGGFLLQIGSYKSEAEANASWQTYKSAHPVVAAYASDIHRAELGAKGTWYRLRVGPFASLTEANAACAKIKASGGNCFPAKR